MGNSNIIRRKGLTIGLIVLLLLVIDQVIKIEVKTGMYLHESIRVTDWFYISFIENNGMAFGMTIVNKLVLSLFRIFAISVVGWYLFRQSVPYGKSSGYVLFPVNRDNVAGVDPICRRR